MNLLARHVILRALLRWTAAVAFCIPLKHRPHARLRALGMLLPLLGLTYVLDPSAQSTSLHELQFSLLTLYVAFFVLLGMMIYACVEIDKKSALYCAVWSLLASQTAYECWHMVEVFFEWRGTPLDLRSLPVMLAQLAAGAFFYFVVCTTLSRKMSYKGAYNIGPRQLTSAFFIGILFMFQAALLSSGQVVVLDRSLVMTMFVGQFYFLTLLYFQTEAFKKSAMQKEMDTLNLLYERQREQYQVARQNVQIINKRCHELKLQIAALRQMSGAASAPPDPELKAHIDEAEKAAQLYDASRNTGNEVLDVVLTLPMVLPPTVVGYFLLLLFGAKRPLGIFFMEHFGVKLVMNWYSAIFASIVVAFPLMYRTARGAFESFDETLAWSAQTLGQSNAWIFWRVRMPCCRQGILAGTVLAFARALGEYGATSMIAGYTPGKTATIATTVYQLWRTNDEAGAMRWVLVDIVISAVVLLAVNLLEKKQKAGGRA